jgi:hypothetical protein
MSKNRVIVEAVLAGRSHAAVAEQYGISKVWVGKLMARWRNGGLEAVDKRSTRPTCHPSSSLFRRERRQCSQAGTSTHAQGEELPTRTYNTGPTWQVRQNIHFVQ